MTASDTKTNSQMGGSVLSMNTVCSSWFSIGDRKNLIADSKMQSEFYKCKHPEF
jgi:hypothetical protein